MRQSQPAMKAPTLKARAAAPYRRLAPQGFDRMQVTASAVVLTTDANVMEIVALVAMYSLTNFFNNVFDPEKDFPAVAPAGSL
jgi:hypothetical protein